MKPIETIYNGYKFRSRLEARWAVFFDSAGVIYEYEPEGFDLDGKWYLPDFYLRQFDIYVEIKPLSLTEKLKKDTESLCALFRDKTYASILLCYGDPAESVYKKFYAWEYHGDIGGTLDINALFFVDKIGSLKLCVSEYRGNVCTKGAPMKENENVGYFDFDEAQNQNVPLLIGGGDFIFDLHRKAARQARFEHGEKG